MVKKKEFLLIGIVIILIVTAIFLSNYYPKKEAFSINTILLKFNIPLGEELINKIKITNNERKEQKFKFYFTNVKDIVSINKKELILKSGESGEVEIRFKDNKNQSRIYFGELIIKNSFTEKKIPIILNVENKNQIFAITQKGIPKYNDIYPGGKLGIEIKIFNLENNNLQNAKIKYLIKNSENELILSEDEKLIIKGNLGITKIIRIPKTITEGNYIFISSIDYNNTQSKTGYLFEISKKRGEDFLGNSKIFIIVILILIMGIIISFFYFIKTRDDLLIQLKKQQNEELKRNLELVKNLENRIKKDKKIPQQKNKIKKLKRAKKEIIKNIKIKQKKQKQELKILKKRGKKNEMKKKISSWKNEGYKMFETKRKINNISKQNIKKDMKNWKKGGYDTSFLNKE